MLVPSFSSAVKFVGEHISLEIIGQVANNITRLTLKECACSDWRAIISKIAIKLMNCGIHAEDIEDLLRLPRLRHLTLSMNSLLGVTAGQYLMQFNTLTCLNIGSNHIGDSGIEYLSFLSGLEELDVSHNSISDEGVRALVGLTRLKRLQLNGNHISCHSSIVLSRMTFLMQLNVLNNKLVGASAYRLLRMNNLQELIIDNEFSVYPQLLQLMLPMTLHI